MTAMTLLRAMSDISPQDMEAALRAGSGGKSAEPESDSGTERPGIGAVIGGGRTLPAGSPLYRLHLGGWAAAAACVLLMTGAILHFRQTDGDFVLAPSLPEQIVEVTGTEPSETTAVSDAAATTEPTYIPQQNTVPEPSSAVTEDSTVPDPAPPPDDPQTGAAPVTEPPAPETQPPVTTTAVTYAENVPILIAMADDAGSLTHADGSDYAHGEYTWANITDAADIDGYLNGEQPVVTLGSGQKSEEIAAGIMQNASMLRIRWQTNAAKWESYGIQYVRLDKNGVLHLHIAMYSDGTPQPAADWIYETALLYESGTLPPVTDVDLQLIYYEDEPDPEFGLPGIAEWIAYISSLPDDIDIHVDPSFNE